MRSSSRQRASTCSTSMRSPSSSTAIGRSGKDAPAYASTRKANARSPSSSPLSIADDIRIALAHDLDDCALREVEAVAEMRRLEVEVLVRRWHAGAVLRDDARGEAPSARVDRELGHRRREVAPAVLRD